MPIYNNDDTTNILHFLAFFQRMFTILPQKMASFGPIKLGIIAHIVSSITNYQYAKFHDFIKNFTIDVIFRRL